MKRRFCHHIFVCTNQRVAGRPSCGSRGSPHLFTALQQAVNTHPTLCGTVAVTSCGCLGPCFDGPNLVIYPDGVFYAKVTIADIDELVRSHLVVGIPVERLRYRWPDDSNDGEGE